MEFVGVVLMVAVCAGLIWLGSRIEPHWVSKDGRRFLCNAQKLSTIGEPETRFRETRVIVDERGELQVDQKRFMRRSSSFWRVEAEAPEPPRGKVVFLLRGHDPDGTPALMAIRLPASSRAVEVLRGVSGGRASRPDRGTG